MRTITGTVISDKMDKTVVVAVVQLSTHPLYKKQYKTTRRYKAHNENNEARTGDVVEITESRPMSATKHFVITKIVEKAGGAS